MYEVMSPFGAEGAVQDTVALVPATPVTVGAASPLGTDIQHKNSRGQKGEGG